MVVAPMLHAHRRPLPARDLASCTDMCVFCSWELPAPIRARRPRARRGGAHGLPGSVSAPPAPACAPRHDAPRGAQNSGTCRPWHCEEARRLGPLPGSPEPAPYRPWSSGRETGHRGRRGPGHTQGLFLAVRRARPLARCGGAVVGSDIQSRRPCPGPARAALGRLAPLVRVPPGHLVS